MTATLGGLGPFPGCKGLSVPASQFPRAVKYQWQEDGVMWTLLALLLSSKRK
eukprot:CAMPEP_0178630716 /NCGR_PEP_ID=MMETSP0698-20121128/10633_1 /TAXON_ID=265572 /ORGANISM="Extubocellulus spinifer, Strain CCMP396" /LENGTH=51 /DNA_ID=CAMNT_0020270111 /DNA_START=390 /DNA_END=545 /DNA_ORIENTATION=+